MKIKAQNPLTYLDPDSVSPIVSAYFGLCHLKQIYRQGWLQSGISPEICESVGEHTLGVTFLAMLLVDRHFTHLDISKVLKMSLLHDVGEIFYGDITPSENIPVDEKMEKERAAVKQVFADLSDLDSYLIIWEEYNAGNSLEAKFVRQIDKLEMALQAKVYEFHTLIDLEGFKKSAEHEIFEDELKVILEDLNMIAKRSLS